MSWQLVQHCFTINATALRYARCMATYERARSAEAKREREESILRAARSEAQRRGTREVTLTDLAGALSATIVARPLFCDLLAHTPLNLERNVSVETVRAFKLEVHEHVEAIATELRRLRPGMTELQAIDVIATV